MNDRTRRSYLARYLSGSMDYSERQTFDGLLATDHRLRSMLDAERLIDDAIRHDRVAIASEHPGTRRNVMAMLATMPRDGVGTVATTAAAGGLSALSKILLLSFAGLATFGGYLALRDAATKDADRTAAAPGMLEDRDMSADSAVISGTGAAKPDADPSLLPGHDRAGEPRTEPAGTDRPEPIRTQARPPSSNNVGRLASGNRPPAGDAAASEAREHQGSVTATTETSRQAPPLRVIRRDSVHVTVSARNR